MADPIGQQPPEKRGFFASLRLPKKETSDKPPATSPRGGERSPRSNKPPSESAPPDEGAHPASLTPGQRRPTKGKLSGVIKRGSEVPGGDKAESRSREGSMSKASSSSLSRGSGGGSLSRAAGEEFLYDPKLSTEVNAVRRRAWEEGHKLDATLTSEFVYNPDLTPEENLVNQRNWEGQQKLHAARARLHHDKEMIARAAAHSKEDQAVTGYMARFAQKLQRKKAKNPSSVGEDIGEEAGVVSSSSLKPGAIKLTDAYLENYKTMTPQSALKKRLLMSEAEKVVNEKGQADSYLNRFLEDKEDAPVKKTHVRRSSDTSKAAIVGSPAAEGSLTEKPMSLTSSDKRPGVFELNRRRSSSTAHLRRSSSSTMPPLSKRDSEMSLAERRELKNKLLNAEAEKVLEAVEPIKSRLARASGAASIESSDVEESSSTFESDEEVPAAKEPKPKGVASTKGRTKGARVNKKRGGGGGKTTTSPRTATSGSSPPVAPVPIAAPGSKATADQLNVVKVTETEIPKLLALGTELGKGAFSLVYKAVRQSDKKEVAVKVIDLSRLTPKQLAEVDAERFILQQFHHPYVVNLLNVFESATRLYYVLELLSGGDLFNKILSKGCFSERATKRIARQIAEAVAAMHALGIVHRDLKPENILCTEDPVTKQIDVKVADFGIAKKIGRGRARSTCIPADHEILTNRGFMDLDAWLQHGDDPTLLVAGFDQAAQQIVFERPVQQHVLLHATRSLVEFCSASQGLSYLVTRDHNVFVGQGQLGSLRKVPAEYFLESASSVYDEARHVTAAKNGVKGQQQQQQPLPFFIAEALSLKSDEEEMAFLSVYGSWVGSGSLVCCECDCLELCFGLQDTDWLRDVLPAAGLSTVGEWRVQDGQVRVAASRWVDFLCDGGEHGLASWVKHLSVPALRQVIGGLWRSGGCSSYCIVAKTPRFRDELVHVLLLAGFSAMFETLDGGATFRVLFEDPQNAREPLTVRSEGEVRACSVASRVWCLTMPSGLLWVRRTQRDAAGAVERAWRAVLTGNCGSPGYVAPEVIRGEEYDMSVDMFSLGAIIYVLLAGYPPFWGEEMETIISKNLNVDFTFAPMYWAHISEPPKKLIRGLIVKDPAARLTAQEVLQSDFLKQ